VRASLVVISALRSWQPSRNHHAAQQGCSCAQHQWWVLLQAEPLFPIETKPAKPAATQPPDVAPLPAAPPLAAPPPPRSGGRAARPTISEAPTCVLRLANMATREELVDNDTYTDILEDVAGAYHLC